MDLATLAVLTLATWQTVEIVHHGAIFESLRARWTAMIPWTAVESHFPRRRWFHRRLWAVKVFRADLLRCPFCLSVWAAAACLLLLQCRWTSWFVFVQIGRAHV